MEDVQRVDFNGNLEVKILAGDGPEQQRTVGFALWRAGRLENEIRTY